MFKNVTDFSFQRTGKEAFGFYLAYLLICMILSGIAGGVFAQGANNTEIFNHSLMIGAKLSVKARPGGGAMIICVLPREPSHPPEHRNLEKQPTQRFPRSISKLG